MGDLGQTRVQSESEAKKDGERLRPLPIRCLLLIPSFP